MSLFNSLYVLYLGYQSPIILRKPKNPEMHLIEYFHKNYITIAGGEKGNYAFPRPIDIPFSSLTNLKKDKILFIKKEITGISYEYA
jgi:hypothetical protein